MGIKVSKNFSDINAFLHKGYEEVVSKVREVGEEHVQIAKETGTYHDVTGNLRASNEFTADKDGLELKNSANYASEVESRGHKVLSEVSLLAEKRLKEIFE